MPVTQPDKSTQPDKPDLSIIIPAKDEAHSIGNVISRIKESLPTFSHEIIVVDDGSRDNTRESARNNGTILVSQPENLGKGAAMKTGVENARGNIVVFLDGDGAHDPQDIPNVVEPILQNKAELVIGSRHLVESKVLYAPLTRRLSNKLASFIMSVIISFLLPLAALFKCPIKWVKITDCTSGFRAIKRESWQNLDLNSQGFEIEAEVIYEAVRNGLTIAEAPISCNWDKQLSRLSIVRDGWKTLKLLVKKLIR